MHPVAKVIHILDVGSVVARMSTPTEACTNVCVDKMTHQKVPKYPSNLHTSPTPTSTYTTQTMRKLLTL